MKKRMVIIFILLSVFSLTKSQVYCPGTEVLDTIYSETVPIHISSYFAGQDCWVDLTDFEAGSSYPSGLDVAVVITQITGMPSSIVDHNTMMPINQGDTLYVRKNNTNYFISLRHLNYSGLSFMYLIIGNPTVYNQAHSCIYSPTYIIYTADCVNYGYSVYGSGTCHTCNQTMVVEKSDKYEIKIYPNPANETVIIEELQTGKIELMNLQGQVIKNIDVSNSKTSIDISKLAGGVYLIKAMTDKGISIKKLIKQ